MVRYLTVLFPDRPRHSLPPRVFGCTCYVHALDPGRDKLDPQSIWYVFFGNSRTQKGYKFYSPSLRRHFVCVEVTFNESLPYFSGTHTPEAESILPMVVPSVPPKPLHVYVRRQQVLTVPSVPATTPPSPQDLVASPPPPPPPHHLVFLLLSVKVLILALLIPFITTSLMITYLLLFELSLRQFPL